MTHSVSRDRSLGKEETIDPIQRLIGGQYQDDNQFNKEDLEETYNHDVSLSFALQNDQNQSDFQ